MKNKLIRISILSCCLSAFLFPSNMLKGQNNLIPSTQDCSAYRPPFEFNIRQVWSATGMSSLATPLAGDVDGDGIVEVFAWNYAETAIYIFDGRDGTKVGELNFGHKLSYHAASFLLCDVDGDDMAEVFVVDVVMKTVALWEIQSITGTGAGKTITYGIRSSVNVPTIYDNSAASIWQNLSNPFVADLDGDGHPEFIVDKHIFDKDLNLKATMGLGGIGFGHGASFPMASDLDGDGKPEIIVGTDIYKYDGATVHFWKRIPGLLAGDEGQNMVADINCDGVPDVVYTNNNNGSYSSQPAGQIIVWTPLHDNIIGVINMPSGRAWTYPVVGDIDGEVINGHRYPEICYNTYSELHAYYYDGTMFHEKWVMPTNEVSGMATFTFFDFNRDGIAELVYRDEQNLRIINGQHTGQLPTNLYIQASTSMTIFEMPIVADVTSDGSANIVVSGSGMIQVFEGNLSPWAACPKVWNQQLYSSELINNNLTVISNVKSVTYNKNNYWLYNGGPMQTPMASEETFQPVDPAPDLYVITGSITLTSPTTADLTVTFGNQGMVTAVASTPIRYYHTLISPANVIGSETLGVDLAPGQTKTITKSITFPVGSSQFYVRIVDDGTNFPALGAYSDCNLSNNHKAFGTLELLKTANTLNACTDGTVFFTVTIKNNTDQVGVPQIFNNIVLIDSLGTGWEYISSSVSEGVQSVYDPVTRKVSWSISSLDPGNSAQWFLSAKATSAGAIRNSSWIQEVGGTVLGREVIEAYVIVDSEQAPAGATISPATATVCTSSSVTLTASVAGKSSYQWYRNNIEITGATQQTYNATLAGNYTVTYFDAPCVSQMSSAATVTESCIETVNDIAAVFECDSVMIDVLANDTYSGAVTLSVSQTPTLGSATVLSGNRIQYKDDGSCDGGKSDKFQYTVSDGSDSKQAEVKVIILKAPRIVLQDSCSTKPKLVLSIRYPATYEWWYSSDGVNYTTNLGVSSQEYYPALTGWYEVRITYTLYGVTLTKKVRTKYTILETVNLPNGQKWYITTSN